jgi:hypothetical protein
MRCIWPYMKADIETAMHALTCNCRIFSPATIFSAAALSSCYRAEDPVPDPCVSEVYHPITCMGRKNLDPGTIHSVSILVIQPVHIRYRLSA